ncbi:MAG TPA: ATP-binding protein, partial [Bacteroidia bacterium]|nr:ATP-binding protein [Bacteroidia bacterium]
MTKESALTIVQGIPELKEVPLADLQWLVESADFVTYPCGSNLFVPGQPADKLFIIVEGAFKIFAMQNGHRVEVMEMEAGGITGVLPYSRMKEAGGYAEAKTDSVAIALHRDRFPDMVCYHHALTEALVHFMTSRVRAFTQFQQQNDKLASLGKLSAGLAHELNNPAAAVVRSSGALKKHLQAIPDKFKKIMHIKVDDAEVDVVNDVIFRRIQNGGKSAKTLMERTALEDELADWMDERGFENAFEWAETLADFEFNIADLEEVNQVVPDQSLAAVIGWIVSNLITEKMVNEIADASKRISELVGSVKHYTHMDRSNDRQPTDMHAGIRSTLTMLGYKIRNHKVSVEEKFAPDLPLVPAFPGEVNQVFTNIIDNAVDAMEATGGKLTIFTRQDGDFVKIDITDTGTGIPPEILAKIFDPFFTTKDIGKGTGLGLDVVQQIMKNRHRGDVKVQSQPGQTTFML